MGLNVAVLTYFCLDLFLTYFAVDLFFGCLDLFFDLFSFLPLPFHLLAGFITHYFEKSAATRAALFVPLQSDS
jgi:hypothetical protein